MNKCKFCERTLPVLRVRRTWTEKYITCRNKFKYQCQECYKKTFISMI